MNPSFWQGKRVFVTGHTGFKGGWLSIWLHNMGAQVSGYALAPATTPNLFDVAGVSNIVQSSLGDIRDSAALSSAITQAQPDIVFHLAAQPLVRDSYSNPLATLETNIMGTARLLECVRYTASVKSAVVVTSDKCYRNYENGVAHREPDPLGGHDPYSASKACAELVAQSWQQSFFQPRLNQSTMSKPPALCSVATARAGNVIGGGDWSKDRLVPDVLRCIDQQQHIVLRNPRAIRPWQHVLEPLAAYLLLAEKLYLEGEQWAQAWNFGPDESAALSVSTIVEKLISESNQCIHWTTQEQSQPHEAQLLALDSSKAHQLLGWKPQWSIDTCIKEIVHWHGQWKLGADMNNLITSSINRYMAG